MSMARLSDNLALATVPACRLGYLDLQTFDLTVHPQPSQCGDTVGPTMQESKYTGVRDIVAIGSQQFALVLENNGKILRIDWCNDNVTTIGTSCTNLNIAVTAAAMATMKQ